MSYHESLNENTDDTLKTHNKYSLWAFLVGSSRSISNSVLGFNWEEEAPGEGVDVVEARDERFGRVLGRVEIAVGEDDQPPDEREEEPGEDEGESEHE